MTTPTPPAPAGVTTPPRLRNGELRKMVAKVLADASGTSMTPRAIAAQLGGRSSGAVGNALQTLADQGHATVAGSTPLAYQATPTTAGVAAAVIVPAPPVTRRPRPNATPTPTPPPPSAPVPAPPTTTASEPIARPNGAMYHPRTLSGMPDVTALQRLRDAGVPALMYGPPGTGKTSVIEAAFPDLETVPGDGDTVVADFVGDYTKTDDGRYVFVYGPLIRAMRAGSVLFIDDATIISPTVLAVVYPAMDGRRQIVIKANGGEIVTAAPGFYVVAGHNPGVHGAILSDALASRFSAQIRVSTDYDLAAELGVDRRAVKAARNLATLQAKGETGWAPQLRELLAFQKIAAALGVEAAAGNLVGIAPDDDRDTVATVVRQTFGAAVHPLALGARI